MTASRQWMELSAMVVELLHSTANNNPFISAWFSRCFSGAIFIHFKYFLFVPLSQSKIQMESHYTSYNESIRHNEIAQHKLDMCNIIAEESMRKALGKHFDFTESEATYTVRRVRQELLRCNKLKDAKRKETNERVNGAYKNVIPAKEKRSIEPPSKDSSAPKNSRLQFHA